MTQLREQARKTGSCAQLEQLGALAAGDLDG
jgi:hypothetical protein